MGLIFLLFLGDINATRSEVEVYIKLSRQYLYHVTQSFFQSWLLGFLAYLTFWVDLEDFNDRYDKSMYYCTTIYLYLDICTS